MLEVKSGDKYHELFLYDFIASNAGRGMGVSHQDMERATRNLKGPLLLRINSPGGEVSEAVGMYNLLTEYAATRGAVDVHIDAEASSAASFLAMVGGTVTAAKNSIIMIHRAWTLAAGNREDMERVANWLRITDESVLRPAYVQKSRKDATTIDAIMSAETFYTADQALNEGFIDKISPANAVAVKSPHANNFRLAAQRGQASEPTSAGKGYADFLRRNLQVVAR